MIKWFICDVDGTMTDGKISMNQVGETFTTYNKLDDEGFRLLKKNSIIPIMVSSEKDFMTHLKRADNLKCVFISIQKNQTKKEAIEKYMRLQKFSWKDSAYIGDDYSDIECLEVAQLSFCPFDSIISEMDYEFFPYLITSRKGGEGAVRSAIEFCINYNKGTK